MPGRDADADDDDQTIFLDFSYPRVTRWRLTADNERQTTKNFRELSEV